jgi:hypothetical protein
MAIVPLFVQGITVALWVPGASMIGLLGGGGLHDDKFGIFFFAVGMLLNVLLYGSIVSFAVEAIHRRNKRSGNPR